MKAVHFGTRTDVIEDLKTACVAKFKGVTMSIDVSAVTCGNCKRTDAFKKAFKAHTALNHPERIAKVRTSIRFTCVDCGHAVNVLKKPKIGDIVRCECCNAKHTVVSIN